MPLLEGDWRSEHAGWFLILAVFLGISRVWVGGYSFGVADNSWQVPAIRAMADGAFSNDYIFNEPFRLSFFFPIIAGLSRLFPLEWVYFGAYAAASVGASVGVYVLGRRMLGSPSAALLAVVLLVTKKHVAAGANTWDPYFLPRTAALPLVLACWAALLDSKHLKAGVLWGVAFAIHPLSGFYAWLVCGAYILWRREAVFKSLFRFAAGGGLLAAATYLYARGGGAPILSAGPEWYEAMLVRNLHHIRSSNFVLLGGLLVVGLWAGSALRRMGLRGGLVLSATAVAAVAYTYCAAAQLAGKALGLLHPALALLHPPILAVLQPLRVSSLFGILIFIGLAGILYNGMGKGTVGVLASAGAAVALGFREPMIAVLLLGASLVARRDSRMRTAAALLVCVVSLGAALVQHKTLFVLLAAGAAVVLAAALLRRRPGGSVIGVGIGVTVALAGVLPGGWATSATRMVFGTGVDAEPSRYERSVKISPGGSAAMLEAAAWAADNAAEDEVTIIPPWWEGFRVASGKPVFGTYKDGTLVFFREKLAGEWLARMAALGLRPGRDTGAKLPSELQGPYAELDEICLAEAARLYGAKYVVRLQGDLAGFREVYGGEAVHIYEIAPQWDGK